MKYLFKKFSIFDFKIMTVVFFLNNRIFEKDCTFNKKITFVKNCNFFSNKNNLLAFSDYQMYFLLGMIGFSINKILKKKIIYQINANYFFTDIQHKIDKIIKNNYLPLFNIFSSYKYIRFILKKNFKKVYKIFFLKQKALFKKPYISHINDKYKILLFKKIKYRKNKVFILKKIINYAITHIEKRINQLNAFYKKKFIIFSSDFFFKRHNLAVEAWKFIIKEKYELKIYHILKIFFYNIKKNKDLKKTWHKYFICFNLFEKMYQKISVNIQYSMVFWMCRFNIEFKMKNNLFNFSITQSLICFILLKKFYKNNNLITDHFIPIRKKINKSRFRSTYLSLLPNKFFLADWNVRI
nr:hypothetical protein Cry52Nrm2_p063 [Cryptomonas curvata]